MVSKRGSRAVELHGYGGCIGKQLALVDINLEMQPVFTQILVY